MIRGRRREYPEILDVTEQQEDEAADADRDPDADPGPDADADRDADFTVKITRGVAARMPTFFVII